MCGHCEATVQKALEALPGVFAVQASHIEGTAIVETDAPVSPDALRRAVEAEDYQVLEIVKQ